MPSLTPAADSAAAQPITQHWSFRLARISLPIFNLLICSFGFWLWYFSDFAYAVFALAYVVYFAYYAGRMGWCLRRGVCSVAQSIQRDWQGEYNAVSLAGLAHIPFRSVLHIIIIPNYTEHINTLNASLSVLARHPAASTRYIAVLAFEETESEAERSHKWDALSKTFAGQFLEMIHTVHPANLPGEVRGKSSNVAWSASHLITKTAVDPDNTGVLPMVVIGCVRVCVCVCVCFHACVCVCSYHNY